MTEEKETRTGFMQSEDLDGFMKEFLAKYEGEKRPMVLVIPLREGMSAVLGNISPADKVVTLLDALAGYVARARSLDELAVLAKVIDETLSEATSQRTQQLDPTTPRPG